MESSFSCLFFIHATFKTARTIVIKKTSNKAIYVGCFKAATWAVKFYKDKGFSIVDKEEAILLRKKYWKYGVDHVENTHVMTMNY